MENLSNMQEINNAWNLVTKTLSSRKTKETNFAAVSPQEFHSAVSVLHQNGLSHIISEWFITSVQDDLNNNHIPEFYAVFLKSERDMFYWFPDALNVLYDILLSYVPAINELQLLQDNLFSQKLALPPDISQSMKNPSPGLKAEVFTMAGCFLLDKKPPNFRDVLVSFFTSSFDAYQSKVKFVKEEEPVLGCYFCYSPLEECCCAEYLEIFNDTINKLYELQLFETIIGDVPINVAQNVVKKHISNGCRGNFELPMLNCLKLWLESTVVPWLSSIFRHVESPTDTENVTKIAAKNSNINATKKGLKHSQQIQGYKDRLLNVLYDSFTAIRMEQLFDIIIEFPESQAALEDLKECLEVTNMRSKLISSLKCSLETRLLHPGVNTSDILTAYISAIKALRVLDTSGVVLQVVSEPVCKYLRSREDTVRCIISSLREDSCGELACELMKGVPLKLEDSYPSDEEVDDWDKWCPDPIDVDPAKASESQRSSDIIGILVNIYGSKELFVNEYRSLLADRILTTFSYNTEREIRYLELLKLRFGESQLHYCEVMLKDIADSKRLNTHLNSGEVRSYDFGDFEVNTMILSAQFWPSFKEEKLRLPEYIWKHLKNFTSAFEALKGNRTLVWKPHLGNVDMEIELKGRSLFLTVSPVHATILWHFQDKPRWTITELSKEIQLEASVLRRKITFWQNHGILNEEENDVFVLMEDQKSANRESVVMIEEEEESVTASSQDMKEEELQTFWSFIVGMLTNMESLPLERIHSMLRMFAIQGTSTNECSIQDMKQFLEKKVRDRQLVYSAGMFKLPKFDS